MPTVDSQCNIVSSLQSIIFVLISKSLIIQNANKSIIKYITIIIKKKIIKYENFDNFFDKYSQN